MPIVSGSNFPSLQTCTGENTLWEKKGKPGEIPTRFSNSLAEIIKNNKIQLAEGIIFSKK